MPKKNLKSYRVWISQVNQVCLEVKARTDNEAEAKAKRKWRKNDGIPFVVSYTHN